MSTLALKEQKKKAIKVTLLGSLLDLLLGLVKISVGLLSNSVALVADGIHSLSDLLTDALVLIITFVAKDGPDSEHPYGHARFETLGTVVIGIFLFSVAGIIFYDGVRRLSIDNSYYTIPETWALLVVIVSIVSKEWIYRYTKKVAHEINSSLLLANAWHSRTDALSSIAVLIGLFAALLGFRSADTLAALAVALLIAKIAWDLVYKSLKELVDTALPKKELNEILNHINAIRGILDAHSLRTRFHGNDVFLDIHIQVDSKISVSEGHFLADKVSKSIMNNFLDIKDVIVHIDPEYDEEKKFENVQLPLREEAISEILICCQSQLKRDQIKNINLHYLNGQIQAEIFIDNKILNSELNEKIKKSTENIVWLKSLRIYGYL